MGYAPKEYIERAGEWLLEQLQFKNPIISGDIFEKSDSRAIGESLGIPEDYEFVTMVECAAMQLEDAGIVTMKRLPELVCDAASHEIFFHWQKLGNKPQFVGMDL
jgi:hypothetical protein